MSTTRKRLPRVLLAMDPALTREMLSPHWLLQLQTVASPIAHDPVTTFDDEDMGAMLQEAELLLTGWGCPAITPTVLAAAPRLQAIVHAGGSVKAHVGKPCFERGIQVSSAAAANAIPVAEFTLAAILWANKRVLQIARDYARASVPLDWEARYPDLGNYRKTVGIVGASRIGSRVLSLLKPFDLELLVYDPYLSEEGARKLGARKVALDELCAESDIVSLHAPAIEQTHHLISGKQLDLMKDGATLINTARQALVDVQALEAHLESGRLYAIIDCTQPFQLPPDARARSLPNVLFTPHIAGSLGAEKARMMAAAIDEVGRFARGEPFAHPVTLQDLEHSA